MIADCFCAKASRFVAVGVVVLFGTVARADDDSATKTACISAAEQSQRLRMDMKIEAAHEKLLQCAQAACPQVVRERCEEWLKEVSDSQATVVFAARDANGGDLVAVNVAVDGAASTSQLDGHAVPIDPGVHTITFRREEDSQTITVKVVIRESEKGRVILASFPKSTPPQPVAQTDVVPLVGYVVGGVGVAFAVAAISLGVVQLTDAEHLQSTCSPNCSPSSVDPIRAERVAAWVLGGASLVSVGVATYLIFFAHPGPARASTSAFDFDFQSIGTHGGLLTVTGRF